MLVAHDADVAGALFQIQVQGKGIERRVCALEKGIGVVFGAVENKVGGGTSIDSFISGFELAWKLFMELNYYEDERSVSCRTAMELRARFASKEEEK